MASFPRFKGLTGSLPVLGAGAAGIAAAATFALVPAAVLEAWVWSSGVAALVPAAEPPLGVTARAILALGGGAAAAAVTWAALYLLWGPGGYLHRAPSVADGTPSLRRADAHPDAPPRRPMSAADLGTPLMDVVARPEPQPDPTPRVVAAIVPAARTLPADLDATLAIFDPDAIPEVAAVPTPPIRALAPAPALAPGERMETFELTPVVRFAPAAERPAPPSAPPSLEQLIRRLEQGAQRRAVQG